MLDYLFPGLDAPVLVERLADFLVFGAFVILALVAVAGLLDVALKDLRR